MSKRIPKELKKTNEQCTRETKEREARLNRCALRLQKALDWMTCRRLA